jgi:arabinan endo-1,5-alpha-L-arabinosidase
VPTEAAPPGDYAVEVKVAVSVPPSGSGFDYSQAGLIIYRDDDNYIKLVLIPINETRQTESAKEVGPVGPGYPRCGNTVVGPPGDRTWLRIARHQQGAEEAYTAYTSIMASALSSTNLKTPRPGRAGRGVKGERSEFIRDP